MGGWAFDPYGQAWLSRFPRPRLSPLGYRPRATRRPPPGPDTYDYYSQKIRTVTDPLGRVVHGALAPLGVFKQGIDALARAGARGIYGLQVPDEMTAGQMLRDATGPSDASRGGLGLTPEMWAKNLVTYAARESGLIPEEAIRRVAAQPTLEETLLGRLPKAVQEEGTLTQQAQQLARTGAGGIQQFMSDLMTDPLLPILGAVRMPMQAAQMLGPAGRLAIPGMRQYAPEVAKVLKEAVKLPGPGAAVQRAAQAMRMRPDMATVEALTKAGHNIETATRVARGASLQKYAHPARVWADRAMHGGFAASMGLGAAEGIDQFVSQGIKTGKLTPDMVEAGVQAMGSGMMFSGIVGGMLGKRAMAKQSVALDKKILPAERYGTRTVNEKLPVDFVPDPLQRQAEAYASSIAERILKEGENAGRLRLSELPQEYSEYSEAIWNQAKGEAQSITMGHSFLERMRQEHAIGKAGITEERGPDGNTRLIQRDKDGKVAGAAELFYNMKTGELELGTIAGGRAMGSKESMRPLYEKLDDMGVVRKEHTTILGTMARRRGAERFYPREVLEGRERPPTGEEAKEARKAFVKAGLEDVMALPAYASAGLLGRSWAPRGYISPRERPLSGAERETRRLAYDLRKGTAEAVALAAEEMAPRVVKNAVLVPIPNSSGNTASNLVLAEAIAKLNPGVQVLDYLSRKGKVPSARVRRLKGEKALTVEEHQMTTTSDPRVVGDRKVYLVDNVVTQGTTFEAARRALGMDAEGLAFARASDHPLYATKGERAGEVARIEAIRAELADADFRQDAAEVVRLQGELGTLTSRLTEAEGYEKPFPDQAPQVVRVRTKADAPPELVESMPEKWQGEVDVTAPDGTPVGFTIWLNAEGKPFAQTHQIPSEGGVKDAYKPALVSTIKAMKEQAIRAWTDAGGRSVARYALDPQMRRFPPKPGAPSKETTGPEGRPVAEPLYSQLRRVVSDPKVQTKQPAEYWLAFLRKNWKTGISGEELKYSGLQDWLRQKGTERVTKDQILDFLDMMDVELKETVYGGVGPVVGAEARFISHPTAIQTTLNAQLPGATLYDAETGRTIRQLVQNPMREGPWGYILSDRTGRWFYENNFGDLEGPYRTLDEVSSVAKENVREYNAELEPVRGEARGTRHEQYTVPGGKNYREIVVSIPVREVYGERASEIGSEGRWDVYDAIGRHLGVEYASSDVQALQKFNQAGGARVGYGFREGHYDPDIPNAIFHVRVKERIGPNGERILEIEELQGDWAQKGREKGFANEAELEAARTAYRKLQDEGTRLTDEARDRGEDPLRPRERPTFTNEEIGRDITDLASGHTDIEQFNQAYNLRLNEESLLKADNLQEGIDLVRRELRVATGDPREWTEVTLATKAAEWSGKGDVLEARQLETLREYMVESGVPFYRATLAALEEGTVAQSVLDRLGTEVPRETANQTRLRKIGNELNTLDEQWGGDIWDNEALARFEGPSGPMMPGGPWVQNTQRWTELGLKRIIKMAADEGFDQVAWLTGARQNRRYSLSQQVSRLEFIDQPKWTGVAGESYVRLEAWNTEGGKLSGADFEQVAGQVPGGSAVAEGLVLPRSEIGRVVGKELARKIESGELLEKGVVGLTQKDLNEYARIRRKEVNSGFAALTPGDVVARDRVYNEVQRRLGEFPDWHERYLTLTSQSRLTGDQAGRLESLEQRILLRDQGKKHIAEGLNLEVGGEGMREYYDRIMPSVAKAIGRRWGVKVKDSEFGYQESALTVEYRYKGPELTGRQVTELGERLEAEGVGQQILSGVRSVREAMDSGASFREAIDTHGSIDLARRMGGKMVADKSLKREPIHVIDIPPEMAEAVRREGFARMAVDAEAARKAEPLPMEEFLLKVYPEDSVIRNPEPNLWEVQMPDGQVVRWRMGADKLEIDLEAFEAGYGRKATAAEIAQGAEGVTLPFPNQAIVDIVEGVRPSVPLHEHWHVVKHLGALTEKQRRALQKRFKGDEEAEAWAFAEWMERRTLNTVFERIWDSLVAVYQQVTGAPEAVFRAAERGELMGREARRRVSLEERRGPAFAVKAPVLDDQHPLLQKKRGGKVTGAPAGLTTGKQLSTLVSKVMDMAEGGKKGQFWYEEAAAYIDRITQGNKADTEKFLQLLAIYSPEQAVGPNWVDAVQAWDTYKGIGVKEGLRRLNAGEELIIAGKTRSMDRLAEDALFRGKAWRGLKTNSFYGNLGVILFPERPQKVTVDRHIMRLMGYQTVSPTPGQYAFSEGVFSEAAKAMGWKPWQVQAGAWTTQRGPGRGPASFPEAAAAQLGAVGLEAVPHRESGHPLAALAEQSYEVRQRYTREAREAWTNEKGVDEIAEGLGLLRHGEVEGPGYYGNEFNPGWHLFAQLVQAQGYRKGKPALESAMTKGGLQRLRQWAGMAASIYHQESAGILRPFATTRKNDSGYLVEMKRVPERAELAAFRDALPEHARAVLEEGGLVLDYSPEGLLVHNLTVQPWWKGRKITNRELAKQAVEAVDKAAPPEVQYDVRAFQSYSELVEPSWKKGEYDARQAGQAFAAESPVVQAAFDRALSRVEAVNQRWTEAPAGGAIGEAGQRAAVRGVEADLTQAPRGPPRGEPRYAVPAVPLPPAPGKKPETVPTVGGVRKPPGEPPRVETRVENLQEAVAEQKKLGIPTDDLVLARELRRNWTAIDPEVQKIIIGWDDVKMIQAAGRRQLTDAEVMALDAVVRGRLEQKELARMAFLERKGTNQEAEAWRDYAEAIAKYVPLERANVNDGSGAGRALAARARIMEAAQTPDRKFLKKVLSELEGLTNKDAEMLVRMFETGDPRMADAMRAYSSGFWKQWQTLLRAMLITPSSEVPNIIGNTIVQGVEIADSAVAAGLDWAVTKARGKPRERYIGELGAELSGWIEAGPAAMGEFLKERFAGIYKRAWTGESLPVNLEKRLEYQVSPFKSKLPRLISTSLDALGAGDQLFRSIIARGLAKKWAYRLSHQRAKRGATKEQIANSGDEILFDLFQRPQKYPEVLQKIRSDTARRLFQGKPWKIVEHLRGMERDWPWLAAALPFVRTPANIARYGIHHSPMGFLSPEAMRAVRVLATGKETYRKGGIEQKMTQGEASDIVASRLVGTAIFGMAVLAAKAGKITGSGPSDYKERRAKMETGWRPYSFVVQIDGRNYYVPYARFDPVAQVMGVAADVAEMGQTRTAEDMASKAMGSIMENFTDRTYLKGLIDFTEALNNPLRFAGQYAVGIATMHIPRQVARIATAIDPVIRDVRPLDRSMMGLPKRLQNSVIRNIPWASKTLAARRGPAGEEIVRPGEGVAGALMRTFSPIQVSPERPGRELEALMAEIGAVPGEQKPYITIQGEQIMLERQDLETLSKADRSAAHELRRFMQNPAFNRLPDTIEEGGSNSKAGVIRDTYRRHRDYARQAMLRSLRFRRMAMKQLREKRRAG